jgi:hypothetical protein
VTPLLFFRGDQRNASHQAMFAPALAQWAKTGEPQQPEPLQKPVGQ